MPIVHSFRTPTADAPSESQQVNLSSSIKSLRVAHGFQYTLIATSRHGMTPTVHSATDDAFIIPTSDLDFLTGKHARNCILDHLSPASVRINFGHKLPAPPKIDVFFSDLDLDRSHDWRLKTTATDIDTTGFTLNIETWSDTVIHNAEVSWIAYAAKRDQIFNTSVNTTDVRPYHNPRLQHNQQITFGDVRFANPPAVFVALNLIDMDCKNNLRITAYVDQVTTTGLTWHIDTWMDSVLYSAGASIIAINAT